MSSRAVSEERSEAASATWIVSKQGGDIRWRAELPAAALGARLITVDKEHSGNYLTPNDDGVFRWRLTEDGAEYPDVEGTVIWTRPDMNRAIHGVAMSANGHRVLAEVDDNYLSPQSQNIFMRMNRYGDQDRMRHMKAFCSMDGIICSTPELRDIYYETFNNELNYCPELFVARNHVNPFDWMDRKPLIEEESQRVRVGWAGSHQHVWDLRLAAPTLHLAKEMGAEIVLIGLDPADHDPEWKKFLGDYTHVPWLDPDEYHRRYINIDIGIAPLVMNQHTLGKSDIKGLEYTMSGAAFVAQNNPVYNTTWKHGETCLLAGSPDEMAMHVAYLIKNHGMREMFAQAAKQYVLEERTIQGNINEWDDAIEGVRMPSWR